MWSSVHARFDYGRLIENLDHDDPFNLLDWVCRLQLKFNPTEDPDLFEKIQKTKKDLLFKIKSLRNVCS